MKTPTRATSRLLSCLTLVLLVLLVPSDGVRAMTSIDPAVSSEAAGSSADYEDLLRLFAEWRQFEAPPWIDGAPDYRAETFEKRYPEYQGLRQQLDDFTIDEWPIPQQVDWHLMRAEMNGFDFNHRVLKPWQRDPAFYDSIFTYRSDVPAHEGPTHHAVVEVWTYEFPLSSEEEERLIAELSVIPPLMRQAQGNLTGNARELWITGIRNIRSQRSDLDKVLEMAGDGAGAPLQEVIRTSREATDDLIAWLEAEAPKKTGPSGIGKENYTWYQQNVHLVPLTWEDEVRLLERELARAWSSLALEEQRNRGLPPMRAAANEAEYQAKAKEAVDRILRFLDEKEVVTLTDFMRPALEAHMGSFVPEARRNFFWIAAHYDPAPLFTHFYHWFELARMDLHPHSSPVRQGALLYNIFDSRNEGTATGVEEMFLHAGLYDDSPRTREIVWIMLAQRAARGLGSLYAHANEMTMEKAGEIHQDWTPRGWMKTEPELLIFEQHLYLRQPGYGTSYVTGKYLLERTLADYAKQAFDRGEEFNLKSFFDQLNSIDSIPISLARWEMTGHDDEIQALIDAQTPTQGKESRLAPHRVGSPPTAEELHSLKAFLSKHWPRQSETEACFYEHFCTAGGPLSKREDCLSSAPLCVAQLDRKSPIKSVLERCSDLFAEFGEAQHELLSDPRGCEAPPPEGALDPAFSPAEAACLSRVICPESAALACENQLETCSREMSSFSATTRRTCHDLRRTYADRGTLSVSGSCPPELDAP